MPIKDNINNGARITKNDINVPYAKEIPRINIEVELRPILELDANATENIAKNAATHDEKQPPNDATQPTTTKSHATPNAQSSIQPTALNRSIIISKSAINHQ